VDLICGYGLRQTGRRPALIYGTDGAARLLDSAGAGLNSTPALISAYVMFVICLLVPTVSYKRSVHERDKKGRVVLMRSIAFRFSGRKLAASLVASCSAGADYLALSGGSG